MRRQGSWKVSAHEVGDWQNKQPQCLEGAQLVANTSPRKCEHMTLGDAVKSKQWSPKRGACAMCRSLSNGQEAASTTAGGYTIPLKVEDLALARADSVRRQHGKTRVCAWSVLKKSDGNKCRAGGFTTSPCIWEGKKQQASDGPLIRPAMVLTQFG